MEPGKGNGGGGRGAPVEDLVLIRQAMEDLQRGEIEFPIKVEGTHTLPYTSHIQLLDLAKGIAHLKLIRPLPHEMVVGASFEMLFSLGDQRYEAPTTFLGRESYLLDRFTVPTRMVPCDRRRNKRYPFRPREKAYVLAQDGGVPGHGLAGPLVNLSLGGLAFRVDRILQLGDQLRITPGLGFFDKGKELPMLKIRDLPKVPLFEVRGTVANAWERGGEIIVGVKFPELKDAELKVLQDVLTIREQMQRASVAGATPGPTVREPRAAARPEETNSPTRRLNPAGARTPDALTRLGRRCTLVVLAMAPGAPRELVRQALWDQGYLRVEAVDALEQVQGRFHEEVVTSRLLMLEAPAGSEAPMTLIRSLQDGLGEFQELPVALIAPGGQPPETDDPLVRPLPWPTTDPSTWLPILDELSGL